MIGCRLRKLAFFLVRIVFCSILEVEKGGLDGVNFLPSSPPELFSVSEKTSIGKKGDSPFPPSTFYRIERKTNLPRKRMQVIIAFMLAVLNAVTVVGLAIALIVGLFYAVHLTMQLERRWGPALNRWIDQVPCGSAAVSSA